LSGNQIGGFPRLLLASAIQTNRIFQPNAIGNIKVENGHCFSSR